MVNIVQDRTKLIGYLGMEQKAGKSRGLEVLEEEKSAEKRGISINSGVVSMLAWLHHASDQHSLFCFLVKFLSKCFLGMVLLYAHVCEYVTVKTD